MADEQENKKGDKRTRKIGLGHNMTTATINLRRAILEEKYCGIRKIPDFMEIEPAKASDVGL